MSRFPGTPAGRGDHSQHCTLEVGGQPFGFLHGELSDGQQRSPDKIQGEPLPAMLSPKTDDRPLLFHVMKPLCDVLQPCICLR